MLELFHKCHPTYRTSAARNAGVGTHCLPLHCPHRLLKFKIQACRFAFLYHDSLMIKKCKKKRDPFHCLAYSSLGREGSSPEDSDSHWLRGYRKDVPPGNVLHIVCFNNDRPYPPPSLHSSSVLCLKREPSISGLVLLTSELPHHFPL